MARLRRTNEKVLRAARAAGIGVTVGVGLAAMGAQPRWLPWLLAAAIGGVGLASSELAVLIGVVALSLPLIAVQPVVGLSMLVVLVVCVRYLGGDGGRGFLILGLSLIGAFLGPVWAGAALAGYLLGAGEGAAAAVIACLVVEATGFALGRPAIGATVTGGPAQALVSFARMPDSLLSLTWLTKSLTSLDGKAVNATFDAVSKATQPLMLLLQPCLWALGAAAAGVIGEKAHKKHDLVLGMAAVVAGVAVPAVGGVALAVMLGMPAAWNWTLVSAFTSVVIAMVFVLLWERVFPPIASARRPAARRASMAAEDADVDELLRLIATAEDKLATDHTSVRTVMITDMKSFSRMTEEDGSVATAKAIQRHRDLLLPVIQHHGGSGKSTGGDGLVAAFESPANAVLAAVAMQQALGAHNAAHPDEREIWVRIGLATGEVVLDRGGRPFIGAALNLAARVMNLADGGQIFSTAEVADAAIPLKIPAASFGDFDLKNIARPVEIAEVLWADDQQPRDPRETGNALYESETH